MPSYISNPIAYGVRSSGDDTLGGPLINEIISGAGITVTEVDVGGGNKKVRISATGGGSDTYTSTANPTADNDSVDTAGLGRVFEVGHYWINITTDDVFVCVDDTATAAIWELVDTTEYKQRDFADDTTEQLVLGDQDDFEAFFIQYYLIAPTINRTRAGIMYITHNDTIADLRDEYVEINGGINVTPSVVLAGGNVRLDLAAVSVGSALKFRYTITHITPVS